MPGVAGVDFFFFFHIFFCWGRTAAMLTVLWYFALSLLFVLILSTSLLNRMVYSDTVSVSAKFKHLIWIELWNSANSFGNRRDMSFNIIFRDDACTYIFSLLASENNFIILFT